MLIHWHSMGIMQGAGTMYGADLLVELHTVAEVLLEKGSNCRNAGGTPNQEHTINVQPLQLCILQHLRITGLCVCSCGYRCACHILTSGPPTKWCIKDDQLLAALLAVV